MREPSVEKHIWWDNNKAMSPAHFAALKADFLAALGQKEELFVQDLFGGSQPEYRIYVRVINELAWHNLFIRTMLVRPEEQELKGFEADYTIIDLPSFRADPARLKAGLARTQTDRRRELQQIITTPGLPDDVGPRPRDGVAREQLEFFARVLGRYDYAHPILDGPAIDAQREHARIVFSGARWTIRDLGSRNGSRLNQVVLVRLAPDELDGDTAARAANGVVAYSAVCTHAQCAVSEFRREKGVLHCPCHQSEFDPKQGGKVVGGPAQRSLAALPIKAADGVSLAGGAEMADGVLVVARPFVGRVGASSS